MRSRQNFELLPSDMVRAIASHLNFRDFLALSTVSKNTHTLFRPYYLQNLHNRFFELLGQANYIKLEKLLLSNPHLVFEKKVQVEGNKSDRKSLLEMAVEDYDIHALRLFEVVLQNNPQQLSRFGKELSEPHNFVDLGPFFQACEAYIKKVDEPEITRSAIDTAWLELGKAQRSLLPPSMLNQFCDKNLIWSEDSEFVSKPNSSPVVIDRYSHNRGYQPLKIEDLGVLFALVRTAGPCYAHGTFANKKNPPTSEGVKTDLKIFKRLLGKKQALIEEYIQSVATKYAEISSTDQTCKVMN